MTVKNKKGSVIVFILLFFLAMIGMIFSFIAVSKMNAVKGIARELGLVWSDSILAEYDRNLAQRYSVFGFYGLPRDVTAKLNYYADQSFREKKYIIYEGARCDLYDYSLGNVKMVKKQILAAGKLQAAGKLMGIRKNIRPGEGETGGTLGNKSVLSELPSRGSGGSISLSSLKRVLQENGSLSGLIREGSNRFFENQYIFCFYKDHLQDHELGQTFFQNEIEYLICGKSSDEANLKGVRNRILGVRYALDLAYVMKDPKRRAEAAAAAEILTPGPVAAATEKAILLAWAAAESQNDWKLLIDGKKVPLRKDDRSWAVDLEEITGKNLKESENPVFQKKVRYIDPGNTSGEDYEGYLQVMCWMMDENTKILRMMDLMQINMKYLYYGGFRMRDYNAGLVATLRINGADYEIRKEYQPEK